MRILLGSINSRFIHSNLAIRSIRAYLQKTLPENRTVVREWNISQPLLEILRDIHAEKPDWIMLSVYIWNVELTLRVIREIKKILPAVKIAAGGPEVSYRAKELLQDYPEIDHIIAGEGEEPACRLLSGDAPAVLESLQPADLDALPFPYDERDIGELGHRIIYYESSRGCPFGCTYCLSSIDRGVRYLGLQRVKNDLDFFLRHKVKLVKFTDRTFNLDPARYLEIWRYILARHNGVTTFHFELVADLLTEDALELLRTAPDRVFQVEIGIQSANPETLRLVDRHTDLKKARENIRRLGPNIHVHVDLIAGLPGESLEQFERSFNYAITLLPGMLQLGFLKILAGTRMADYARANGFQFQATPPYEVLSTPVLSFDDLCLLKDIEKVLRIYYNSGRFRAVFETVCGTPDPFSFFRNLVIYLKKNGGLAEAHKPGVYADYLQEFLAGKPPGAW